MRVETSRLLLFGAFAPLLLTLPDAKAIVLGEIRTSSRVGQILRAEIEVGEHPAERFDPGCLKLYRPSVAGDDLPWITTARLSYRREDGQGRLSVLSQTPVVEPVVHLAVRSECASGTDRQYTLLLTAPSAAPPSSAPGSRTGPARVAQAESAAGNKAERRTDGDAAPPHKPSLPIEPPSRARADAGTKDETSSLSLSEEISLRAPGSGLERDLFRLERRALDMLNDPLDDQQAMSNKLAWLEANVAELKRAAEQLEGGVTATLTATTSAEGVATVRTGAAPASTTPPPLAGAPPVDPGTTANAAPVAVPAASQPPAPRSGPKTAAWSDPADPNAWLTYGGSGVVLLLLLLLVRHRRSASRQARSAEGARATLPAGSEADFSITEEEATALVSGRSARGGRPRSALAPPASSLPASTLPAATPPATSPALSSEPEIAGAAPALELAEIMLSFGQVSGAARTLEEYIAVLPQESVRPWIRLLQLYQRNGMRKEFEALTVKLNRSFNVEMLRWDGGRSGAELELVPFDSTRQKAVTLEAIPHICERIVSLWGKPECVGYLERLLRDNRDGQRSGFTLPVVEEIVFLIDLITNREVGHQSAQQP